MYLEDDGFQIDKVGLGPSLAKGELPPTPQEMPIQRPICEC